MGIESYFLLAKSKLNCEASISAMR